MRRSRSIHPATSRSPSWVRHLTILAVFAALLVVPALPASAEINTKNTTAQRVLKELPVKPERGAGYDRDLFRHWITIDGCSVRQWVLVRQAKGGQRRGCDMAGASWFSAFDGATTTNSSLFDIDHMVPLSEAWGSGARRWGEQRRIAFANDLAYRPSLIAVSASSNRSKGDRDPAEWMPPRTSYKCTYLVHWVAVKYRWGLSVDRAEKRAISAGLVGCSSKLRTPPKAR